MPVVPMPRSISVDPSARPLSGAAPPAAFGLTGQVLEDAAKAVGVTGEVLAKHAEQRGQIDAKIDADTHVLGLAEKQQALRLRFVTETQGNRATEEALTAAHKELEDMRIAEGETLKSPYARDLFNSQSRIGTVQTMQSLSTHVAQEQFKSKNAQVDANIANAVRVATMENFGLAGAAIANQVHSKAVLNGMTDEEAKAVLADRMGDAAYSISVGAAAEDPAKARAFYDKQKDLMSPQQRAAAEAQIRASEDNHLVTSIADQAVAAAMGGGPTNWRQAIANIESNGGNYNAVGKVTRTGDRAYGKYQVMGANIGPWTKRVLGKAMTPAQFLADPAAQDKVFDTIFGGYVQQYGSPAEAASRWFTGKSVAEGAALQDVNKMTGAEYVRRFSGGMDSHDAMMANSAAVYDAIARDPRLHGDPKLINQAQNAYMSNLGQQQTLYNMQATAASNDIIAASEATGITDISKLIAAQPQLQASWTTLSPRAQMTLTNSLTAEGNKWNPVKEDEFHRIMGMQVTNPQAFLAIKPTELDLPKPGRDAIFSAQLAIQKKDAKTAQMTATFQRVVGFAVVRNAISSAKFNDKEYDQFSGTTMAALEDWQTNNPGKKIGEKDALNLVSGILSKKMGGNYFLGIRTGDWVQDFKIPKDIEADIRTVYEAKLQRTLTDAEVGQIYYQLQRAGNPNAGR